MDNYFFMNKAYELAKKAFLIDEVPVGAVVVYQGKIIGRGYNKKVKTGNPIMHAEMIAIAQASKKIGDWRLDECSLYVTLEPCPMCKGAIVESRIKRVCYGTTRDKQMFNYCEYGKNVIVENLNMLECAQILSDFFIKKRSK